MRQFKYISAIALACMATGAFAQDYGHGHHGDRSRQYEEDTVPQVTTLTRKDGAYLVNTTAIGADVRGFKGRVPLLITIRDNMVESIEALSNRETPRFMRMAASLLDKWNGKKVKEAQTLEVDGVTGATFTSKAIKEHVRLGLEYYQKNK